MRAWLTPETLPASLTCYRVWIPDSDLSRRAFYGAIMLLEEAWNWQQFGAKTPEETAAAWAAANLKTITEMRPCMIGMIFNWPGTAVPENSLVCDGSEYNKNDYPYLFGVIGQNFGGSGDMFAVPNMVSRFVKGTSLASGQIGDKGGASTVTLTLQQIPQHAHTINAQIVPGQGGTPLAAYGYSGPLLETGYAGGGGSHENEPPWIKLVPCIVAK